MNEGKSKLAEKETNSNVVSSAHKTSSEAFGIPYTTPLVARINDLERKMIDGKLVLVDDDGKPLEKEVGEQLIQAYLRVKILIAMMDTRIRSMIYLRRIRLL
ncbi:hypothetical protein Tco_1169460 [Tanacetum coccineum]